MLFVNLDGTFVNSMPPRDQRQPGNVSFPSMTTYIPDAYSHLWSFTVASFITGDRRLFTWPSNSERRARSTGTARSTSSCSAHRGPNRPSQLSSPSSSPRTELRGGVFDRSKNLWRSLACVASLQAKLIRSPLAAIERCCFRASLPFIFFSTFSFTLSQSVLLVVSLSSQNPFASFATPSIEALFRRSRRT